MNEDLSKLILAQSGKHFLEAAKNIDNECQRAEQLAKAKDKTIASEGRERRADLGRILFWFHYGSRPDGIKANHWSALKSLAKDFVDRGILKPTILKNFE